MRRGEGDVLLTGRERGTAVGRITAVLVTSITCWVEQCIEPPDPRSDLIVSSEVCSNTGNLPLNLEN